MTRQPDEPIDRVKKCDPNDPVPYLCVTMPNGLLTAFVRLSVLESTWLFILND